MNHQNDLQNIDKEISDHIRTFSPKLNQSAEKAEKALEGLVLAVNEKIKENAKTPWEKVPILGQIILFFDAESYEARQKENPLASELMELQGKIKGAIADSKLSHSTGLEDSAKRLLENIAKINMLCEKNDINNESFEKQSSNFHDLAAALTAKTPRCKFKEDNTKKLESTSKDLSEAKNARLILVAEKEKLVEMRDSIGNDAPKHINSVSVELQSR